MLTYMKRLSRLSSLSLLCILGLGLVACKPKYQPRPEDTLMGSGYSQRHDYIESSEAYQAALEEAGLELREEHHFGKASTSQYAKEDALVSIYFQFDNFTIDTNERPKLSDTLEQLKDNSKLKLLIVGHCDYHGTAAYNMALGEKRAKSVRDYLIQAGADSQRIDTLSRGDLDAEVRTGSPAETSQDRRADVFTND